MLSQPLKQCFAAIANPSAQVLILGSMPGERSLTDQQYYAHPQNAFWRIMATITGVAFEQNYKQRIAGIVKANLALWDVIAYCEREGSLDQRIEPTSIVVNDFENFFAQHPQLQAVGLNGSTAYRLFVQHVVKKQLLPANVSYQQLPSTSPAHAQMTLQQKIKIWQEWLSKFKLGLLGENNV